VIAVLNYGAGNIGSLMSALYKVGARCEVVETPERIDKSSKLILPGVGHFQTAMERLDQKGLSGSIRDFVATGKPILGICLGMQLMATDSSETHSSAHLAHGLGIFPCHVRRLNELGSEERLPHIGWNSVSWGPPKCPLSEGIPQGTDFYFVHSFAVESSQSVWELGVTDYGASFCSAIWNDNIFGVQFHPEKSSAPGRRLLRNFVELA
jgi:glutamine amidotransferase